MSFEQISTMHIFRINADSLNDLEFARHRRFVGNDRHKSSIVKKYVSLQPKHFTLPIWLIYSDPHSILLHVFFNFHSNARPRIQQSMSMRHLMIHGFNIISGKNPNNIQQYMNDDANMHDTLQYVQIHLLSQLSQQFSCAACLLWLFYIRLLWLLSDFRCCQIIIFFYYVFVFGLRMCHRPHISSQLISSLANFQFRFYNDKNVLW